MKHEIMRNHKETIEKMKEELRRNDARGKQGRKFEEVVKVGQENTCSGTVIDQRSDLARKSSDEDSGDGANQHKLQAPVECDIPRTPTPDYADLNARFIVEIIFSCHSLRRHSLLRVNHKDILGLKISWV